MDYEFLIGDDRITLRLEKKEDGFVANIGEEALTADIRAASPHALSIVTGKRSWTAYVVQDGDRILVHIAGHNFEIREPGRDASGFLAGEEKSQEELSVIKAPMPGKVIKINVAETEEIRKNQTLAIVEAMKMENEIKSSVAGIVRKIHVSVGDLVDPDNPLIELDIQE